LIEFINSIYRVAVQIILRFDEKEPGVTTSKPITIIWN